MLSDNLFLTAIAVLIVLVLVILATVLYFASRQTESKPGQDPKLVKLRFDSLRSSFKQAVELIENNIVSRSERYSIPWVLVLNEGQSERQLPVEQSGVSSALSTESASSAATQGISWHFFDKGIVIDMQGSYLGSPDDEDANEKPWDEFLGLCRNYRPQRPFDSVVITVPSSLLQNTSADGKLELTKLARTAHRRLWLAQNRFAMRFAVYVVVSECEGIEGFSQFARTLPESMRAGMLGWSSPFDLSTTYQSEWVVDAVNSVVRTVADTSAELFALDSASAEVAKFFLLPSRIQAMSDQLLVYVDELMRPSAYHEPFFFRGIYLSGDNSQSAQIATAMEMSSESSDEDVDATPSVNAGLMREPAFLRDLFEKKIFLEYGVARPSKQKLTRPAISVAARWVSGLLLGGWAAGLLVTTLQLERRNPELVRTLAQIQADAAFRARASELNEVIPASWYRSKTLNLLAEIEKLGTDRPWTFLMPGAWEIFEDIDARVANRIEREFGESAINTLRRELYSRAAEITGIAQDDSTSELIMGGECAEPSGFDSVATAPRKSTLAIEELPEFSALNQYLTSVEKLDQAIVAMVRLQKPSPNANDDLRLLVKYTLGAELPGNLSQSIRYFHGNEVSGRASPAGISITHINQAIRCSLTKGVDALNQRLFLNNDLLVTERLISAQSSGLFGQDGHGNSYAHSVASFKQIIATIKEQELLVASGKGGWMVQPSVNLGKSYEGMLARVGASTRLMGPDVVEQLRTQASSEFVKMLNEYEARFSASNHPGVVWNEKDMRFSLSEERIALRNALTSLLAQPFMTPPSDRDIPSSMAQSVLNWDGSKLDSALKLADVYKTYAAEGLTKFPENNRAGMIGFVNSQFARLLSDQILDSMSITGRSDPGSMSEALAFESSRSRLTKAQELLSDWGAKSKADNLRSLISQDAVQRLLQVSEKLAQLDLYAIRGRDFKWWTGEKGPLLHAFGVVDGPSLLQYLGVQLARVESLGKQADIYLTSLDVGATDSQVARRWQAIGKELERYKLKNPNGTLVTFEQFLITNGVDTDRSNCTDKLANKGPVGKSTDFFSERHSQIFAALSRRCSELHLREQQEQWTAFASSFNRLLAGRAPFSSPSIKEVLDADFDEVGLVLKSFDQTGRMGKDAGSNSKRNNPSNLAIARFVDQFERVKAFLSPLYPTEEGAVAGYDLTTEFRVNQSSESEGNKVIDWTLEIGPQIIRLRDSPRPLRWEPGMPVVLTLRLAKDSPVIALPDASQPNMSTDGKNVVYRFTDVWSLLRMLQRHKDADSTVRSDSRGQLIRMEFPLSGTSEGVKASGQETRARVYLRWTLMPVGKRTPLNWPNSFPTRAPEFNGVQ